jgi:hypothetical protein
MRLKRQDMAVKGGALAVAQEVLAIQRAAREHNVAPGPEPAARERDDASRAPSPPPEPVHTDTPPEPAVHSNRVIEAWQRQRALAAQG